MDFFFAGLSVFICIVIVFMGVGLYTMRNDPPF
jgi:hypothetical protein